MQLILDETQLLLEKTVLEFVTNRSPVARVREARSDLEGPGYSEELWQEMASMGWVGVHFPEAFGGSGLGFSELCVILEGAGRSLMPEPFLSTVLLGAGALLLGGSEHQQEAWLPAIAAGRSILALGFEEARGRYNPHHIETTAREVTGGFSLNGEKTHVFDAGSADGIIVSARVAGESADPDGIGLFLLAPDAPGVSLMRQRRVDGRASAVLKLADVVVLEEAVIGTVGEGGALLESLLDRARIGLAAEMLGGAEAAFAGTLSYLKEREQFGVPIGSFQALAHRAARLFMELQLSRSAVLAAARAVDEAPERVPELASLAKSRCADLFVHVTNEGVQMHGGVGMTDEYDIGLYMKRARATDALFGDSAWHRERWASLRGY